MTFICEKKQLTDGERELTELVPLTDELPPEGFHRFLCGINVQVGVDRRTGQPQVIQGQFEFDADTHEEAFATLAERIRQNGEQMRKDFHAQMMQKVIATPGDKKTMNRLNGNLRITE
jgi:hypothetical protein